MQVTSNKSRDSHTRIKRFSYDYSCSAGFLAKHTGNVCYTFNFPLITNILELHLDESSFLNNRSVSNFSNMSSFLIIRVSHKL